MGPAKSASVCASLELGRRLAARRLHPGAAIRGPADVFAHFHPSLRLVPHERFIALLLDGRHRVLREEVVSQGTLTASLVHPREVFRPALRESAAALILVHNHPSGDPTPSAEDREVTLRLVRAGELLGRAGDRPRGRGRAGLLQSQGGGGHGGRIATRGRVRCPWMIRCHWNRV